MRSRRLPTVALASLTIAGCSILTHSFLADAQEAKPKVEANKTEGTKKLWGALILATNEPTKKDFTKPSADLQKRLKKVFSKYKTFELLGESTEALFKDTYSWVAPSKEVCVKFDSKGLTEDGGIKLDLQLWSQDKAILKTDAILKANSPVFIEGPNWGKGRLLFVVQVQEEKSKKR